MKLLKPLGTREDGRYIPPEKALEDLKKYKVPKDTTEGSKDESKSIVVTPSLEQLVDFSNVKLQIGDREAIYNLYGSVGKNPEDFYNSNNEGRIRIEGNRIIYLDVSSMGLTSLPEGIGDLQALKGLYVGHNQLISLPERIGDLKALEVLYVGGNKLTSLPERIGDLQALEILYVSHNKLTSLPGRIGDLQALKELYVSDNKLNKESQSLIEEIKKKGVLVIS